MNFLNQDVKSVANKKCTYGLKGEAVTIIATHGNVLIVENTKKERFSVTATSVSQMETKNVDTLNVDTSKRKPETNNKPKQTNYIQPKLL